MRPRRGISGEDTVRLFDEAVRERALAVLTLQSAGDWRSFKSRFLERDPNRKFFVLDYQPVESDVLPELVCAQCVGVSFRSHSRKVLFATVVEAKGHFLFDDRSSVAAVRYRWPESVTELQRRSYYRTPVPETMNLLVTLWPGGVRARPAAQNDALQVLTGTLADVSCGGALIRLGQVSPAAWAPQQTLGVEVQLPDGRPPLTVDACFRGVRHDQLGQGGMAIQFIGLELTVDGRLALQRLAGCVQRLNRLGISSGNRDWNSPRPQ